MVKTHVSVIDKQLLDAVRLSSSRFVHWLDDYGEISQDQQDLFAGPWGGRAKALYYTRPLLGKIGAAPLIFCEAFVPSTRRWLRQPTRFPIADAHYAMGFAFLANTLNENRYYERALHFLGQLEQTRCPHYEHYCWGYPFDWVTRRGTVGAKTPLITTTPYVYEAFHQVYTIDNDADWLRVMRSIAEHAYYDIKDLEISSGLSTCTYHPHGSTGVVNANAYRAFLLTHAAHQFSEEKYWDKAQPNLNFVLQNQQPNGSWYYAVGDESRFIDHFHTCFVLKALSKIEQLTGHVGCREAIKRGVQYYIGNLFTEDGLPRPFSEAPRFTVYKHDLYDYAECINLAVLLQNRFEKLSRLLVTALQDLLTRWQKPDGSYRSRKLLIGWDNVPMHRWAQSQLFRSLSFLLYQQQIFMNGTTPHEPSQLSTTQ